MLGRVELLVGPALDDVRPLSLPFGPATVATRHLVEVVRDQGQPAMRMRPPRQLLDDLPLAERHAELARLTPEPMRVRRTLVSGPEDAGAAEEFSRRTLLRGHEGVVVKALDAPYSAGRRGAAWLKVKPVHTLDLVVLAAEWGHGRRTGKLSNLHLGARARDGGFVMLGKTFKGMTDAVLAT